MAKAPVGLEIKTIKVFDAKFEAGAKVAAKKGVDLAFAADPNYALGKPNNGGYMILLNVSVVLDKPARKTHGTCTWEIFVMENGQRKMFPAMKQKEPAKASVPDVDPNKVVQLDIDEAAQGAAKAEVAGILKKLP